MKRATFCLAFVVLALCFTAASAFAADHEFKVHFIAGPQGFSKPKVKLHLEGTNLVLTGKVGKKNQRYQLPLQNVTFMAHSPTRFNRASQVSKTVPNVGPPALAGGGGGLGGAGNILALFAWGAYEVGRGAAVGVAATQHGKQHFITIDWRDEGVEYELLFEASKDDYSPLIALLEQGSGKKLFDFEARWNQAKPEIDREASHVELVSLKKMVRLGELSLSPGDYSVVAIRRQDSAAEIYFFEGKRIDSTTLRGVGPAVIGDAKVPPTLKEPEVDYTETAPIQIKEIRTATRTLTFVALVPAAPPEQAPIKQQ